MVAKVIGMGDVIQGTSKKTGREYLGQTLCMTYEKPNVTGLAVMEQFISFLGMEKQPVYKLGQELYLDFDSQGRLLGVEPAQ